MRDFLLALILIVCVGIFYQVAATRKHAATICGSIIETNEVYKDTLFIYHNSVRVDSVVVYKMK